MMTPPFPTIAIFGPTASGKTPLAIALAKELNGEIINADSMQVYADLEILTARPTAQETSQIPHHLYAVIGAMEVYSVGKWLKAAMDKVYDIGSKGKTPILVGGTGLYFLALFEGLAKIPDVDATIEEALLSKASYEGTEKLYQELLETDPDCARKINSNDLRRILRALGVFQTTGQRLSYFQKQATASLSWENSAAIGLYPDREWLYSRINQRFDDMIDADVMSEVEKIAKMKIPTRATIRTAHGLPHLLAYFADQMALEDAIYESKKDTRNYAKRQYTFLRGRLGAMAQIKSLKSEERLSSILCIFDEIKKKMEY